ncbi:hypothetical protein ACFL06_00515 [Patescibacteria group bacterium]
MRYNGIARTILKERCKMNLVVNNVERINEVVVKATIRWEDRQITFVRGENGLPRVAVKANLSGARIQGLGEGQLSFPPNVYRGIKAMAASIFSGKKDPEE